MPSKRRTHGQRVARVGSQPFIPRLGASTRIRGECEIFMFFPPKHHKGGGGTVWRIAPKRPGNDDRRHFFPSRLPPAGREGPPAAFGKTTRAVPLPVRQQTSRSRVTTKFDGRMGPCTGSAESVDPYSQNAEILANGWLQPLLGPSGGRYKPVNDCPIADIVSSAAARH